MLAGSPLHDHLSSPRGRGRLSASPHQGAAGGSACGDLVRIAVEVVGDRVVEAGFDASGCAAARAAGSAVVELAAGALLLEAARTTPGRVAEELGGLSPAHRHAAVLAADALHRALGTAVRDGAATVEASPNRTLVAMSGGVDSAVAAQLAVRDGHEAVGVTLELWADPDTDGERSCCSPQAVTGARALAHRMGLPHFTLDMREAFRGHVVDDFVAEHAAGRTPNPCVRCNGGVRFDAMLELAESLGAARLATGHYAGIEHDADGPLLRRAADPAKDQTYMLARLQPEALERLWFPLEDVEKREVRGLARAFDLPVAEKPESQDLCFLAGTARERFLRRHGSAADGPEGEVVDRAGAVLARHRGQERFTVGQRRGLGVSGPEPLYVLEKDAASGRVVVGPRSALAVTRVALSGVHLHRPATEVDRVKLRYRSEPVGCRVLEALDPGGHGQAEVTLDEPFHGVTPGQTACLMRGDAIVGWAIIEASSDPAGASEHPGSEAVPAC